MLAPFSTSPNLARTQSPSRGHWAAVMGRLIHYLTQTERPLSPLSLDPVLLSTYFLLDLDNDDSQGVVSFVTHTLSRLLQQLNRSTEQRPVLYEGQVRGRILWPATYKARHSDGFNPSRYVCQQVNQRFDTPENQLLKYLMVKISSGLQLVPETIRHGHTYRVGAGQTLQAIAEPLGQIETSLNNLWRNVRLAEITTPAYITEQHLLKAQTMRFEEYNLAAHLYYRYKALVLQPSWEAVQVVGQRVVCLPAQTGVWEDQWIMLAAALLRESPRESPKEGANG